MEPVDPVDLVLSIDYRLKSKYVDEAEKQFHGTSLEELRQTNIQEMKNLLEKDIGD